MTINNISGSLTGKTVLITGAAGILGSQTSQQIVQKGGRVILVDLNETGLEKLAVELNKISRDVAGFYSLDITDKQSVTELRDQLAKKSIEVDVLINNATCKTDNIFEPFETFPLDDWDQVMNVNIRGAMLFSQVFGGQMAIRGDGNIVNILSIYGIVAPDQRIYEGAVYEGRNINSPAVYSVAKAGLLGLTKYLASYWGGAGVRVNAVTPGGDFQRSE